MRRYRLSRRALSLAAARGKCINPVAGKLLLEIPTLVCLLRRQSEALLLSAGPGKAVEMRDRALPEFLSFSSYCAWATIAPPL